MYRFIKEFYRVKAKLPRYVKNDLGQMVSLSALSCVKGIVVANGSLLKTKTLSEIIIEIEAIWTLLRLLYDLKGISLFSSTYFDYSCVIYFDHSFLSV